MKELSFLELEKEMTTLNEQEMSGVLAGNGGGQEPPSWDCVLNCFDYMDDGTMNGYSSYYSGGTYMPGGSAHSGQGYPYNPEESGGFRYQDFHDLAALGGLNLTELSGPVGITASGRTADGRKIMMTMPGADGKDHAVVVIGSSNEHGVGQIEYKDPTTGETKYTASSGGNISGYYAVSSMNSTTSFPSTTSPTTTFPTTTPSFPTTTIV